MLFDFTDGDFIFGFGDNGLDMDGNLMYRMGDNMAMDLNSGEMHFVDRWDDDNDIFNGFTL